MSYILDALKKAEQERRLGKTPDITSAPAAVRDRPKRRIWLYAVLIILAALAGSAGWYLGYEQTRPGKTAARNQMPSGLPSLPATQQATQPVGPAAEDKPGTISTGTPAANEEKSSSSYKAVAVKPAVNKDAVPQQDTIDRTKKMPAETRATPSKKENVTAAQAKSVGKRSPEEGPPQAEKKPLPDNRIYAINELPEEIRQGLPRLTISTHIYAQDKSERLAAINGHIGREGQEVMPGIALESITPDGAVLRFQGYKFRVVLK